MRVRLSIAVAAVIAAIGLGFVARSLEKPPLDAAAGLLWLLAIILLVSLLPFWRKIIPAVPAMPGLFQPVGPGQRWCAACGTPAGKAAPCGVCGGAPKIKQPRVKRQGRKAKGAGTKQKPARAKPAEKPKAPPAAPKPAFEKSTASEPRHAKPEKGGKKPGRKPPSKAYGGK